MPTPELGLRELPYDCAEAVFGSYLRTLELHQLDPRLLACSRIILGPSAADGAAADPDHPVWKTACAALGLTRWRVEPTWRATFERLTRERTEFNWAIMFSRNDDRVQVRTPSEQLLYATGEGFTTVVACMLEANPDLENLGYDLLSSACLDGFTDMLIFLLCVPGIHARRNDVAWELRRKPLLWYAVDANVEVVDALLRLGNAADDILAPMLLPYNDEPYSTVLAKAADKDDDTIYKRLQAELEEKNIVREFKMRAL